jgi:hypothetical protein
VAFIGNASRERGKKEVDNLLSNYLTYESIQAEFIVTVEMDTFFRRKIPDEIFQGDYWGNPWSWKPEHPGGGGVTIRNIKNIAKHCRKLRSDVFNDLHTAQDAWLSDTIYTENGVYPDIYFRANHIMESIPVENPVAVHQFWTYLDQYQVVNKDIYLMHLENILKFEI